MIKKVFKYKMCWESECKIQLPMNAKVLDVKVQNGDLCMWCLVDPYIKVTERVFRVYGTGEEINYPIDSSLNFIKTFFSKTFVFHVFEVAGR